jgi:hypothetical protein
MAAVEADRVANARALIAAGAKVDATHVAAAKSEDMVLLLTAGAPAAAIVHHFRSIIKGSLSGARVNSIFGSDQTERKELHGKPWQADLRSWIIAAAFFGGLGTNEPGPSGRVRVFIDEWRYQLTPEGEEADPDLEVSFIMVISKSLNLNIPLPKRPAQADFLAAMAEIKAQLNAVYGDDGWEVIHDRAPYSTTSRVGAWLRSRGIKVFPWLGPNASDLNPIEGVINACRRLIHIGDPDDRVAIIELARGAFEAYCSFDLSELFDRSFPRLMQFAALVGGVSVTDVLRTMGGVLMNAGVVFWPTAGGRPPTVALMRDVAARLDKGEKWRVIAKALHIEHDMVRYVKRLRTFNLVPGPAQDYAGCHVIGFALSVFYDTLVFVANPEGTAMIALESNDLGEFPLLVQAAKDYSVSHADEVKGPRKPVVVARTTVPGSGDEAFVVEMCPGGRLFQSPVDASLLPIDRLGDMRDLPLMPWRAEWGPGPISDVPEWASARWFSTAERLGATTAPWSASSEPVIRAGSAQLHFKPSGQAVLWFGPQDAAEPFELLDFDHVSHRRSATHVAPTGFEWYVLGQDPPVTAMAHAPWWPSWAPVTKRAREIAQEVAVGHGWDDAMHAQWDAVTNELANGLVGLPEMFTVALELLRCSVTHETLPSWSELERRCGLHRHLVASLARQLAELDFEIMPLDPSHKLPPSKPYSGRRAELTQAFAQTSNITKWRRCLIALGAACGDDLTVAIAQEIIACSLEGKAEPIPWGLVAARRSLKKGLTAVNTRWQAARGIAQAAIATAEKK